MKQDLGRRRQSTSGDEGVGRLKEFFQRFRVAWRLLWDKRVPLMTKMVPLLTLVYILSPWDIMPDFALGLGQLDDLTILLVGLRMFISLSPPDVVADYRPSQMGEEPESTWVSPQEIIALDPVVLSSENDKRSGNRVDQQDRALGPKP